MVVVVHTLASKLVRPCTPPLSPCSNLWSSNLDLVIMNGYIKTVYFYSNCNEQPDFFSIDVLTKALSLALSHYYPMAGRLAHDESGRLEIACNGSGALFVEALADCTFEELGDFAPHPKLLDLVPKLDSSQDSSTWPLLIIQVTTFKCGGVSLGVGIEHHVADGRSATKFLNSWADIARGGFFIDKPYFDRKCLKARSPPTPLFAHDEYLSLSLQPKKTLDGRDQDPQYLRFSKQDVINTENPHLELNGQANIDSGNKINPQLGLQGLDVGKEENPHSGSYEQVEVGNGKTRQLWLNGHGNIDVGIEKYPQLGLHGQANTDLGNGEDPKLGIHRQANTDLGNGEDPKLGFHGQATESTVKMFEISKEFLQKLKRCQQQDTKQMGAPFTSHELLAAHVWRCACAARNLGAEEVTKLTIAVDGRSRLDGMPEGYFGNVIFTSCVTAAAGEVVAAAGLHNSAGKIRKTLRRVDDAYCRSALDFLEREPDLSKFVKGAHTFASPNVGFTSWVQLPMYECDFGWGKPTYVGPAHIPWEGLVYVLASPRGFLRLLVSFQRRHIHKFSEALMDVSDH